MESLRTSISRQDERPGSRSMGWASQARLSLMRSPTIESERRQSITSNATTVSNSRPRRRLTKKRPIRPSELASASFLHRESSITTFTLEGSTRGSTSCWVAGNDHDHEHNRKDGLQSQQCQHQYQRYEDAQECNIPCMPVNVTRSPPLTHQNQSYYTQAAGSQARSGNQAMLVGMSHGNRTIVMSEFQVPDLKPNSDQEDLRSRPTPPPKDSPRPRSPGPSTCDNTTGPQAQWAEPKLSAQDQPMVRPIHMESDLQTSREENSKLKNQVARLQERLQSNAASNMRMKDGQNVVGDREIKGQWLQFEQNVDRFVKDAKAYKGIKKAIDERGESEAANMASELGVICKPNVVSKMLKSDSSWGFLARATIWAMFTTHIFGQHVWAGTNATLIQPIASKLQYAMSMNKDFHQWRCQTATVLERQATPEEVEFNIEWIVGMIERKLCRLIDKPGRFHKPLKTLVTEATQLDAILSKQPAWFYLNYPTPNNWDRQSPIKFDPQTMKTDMNESVGKEAKLIIIPGLWKSGNARWQDYNHTGPLTVDGGVVGAATVLCNFKEGIFRNIMNNKR